MSGKYLILIFTLVLNINLKAQELSTRDKILDQKIVLGFPQITDEQLDAVKSIYISSPDIITAKFIKGNNYCMLIELAPALNKFTVYDELIKIAYTAYDISKCYVKPTSAYNEILQNTPVGTEILIK